MRKLLGVVMLVGGLLFGLYAGLWVCFVGGIAQIVNALQASPVDGIAIALGVLRFLCSGGVFVVASAALVLPGLTIYSMG